MTAALFALRRMQGVRRPALAVELPVPGRMDRPLIFLDVGANAEARAVDLVQFAYLGSAFSAAVLGIDRPRIGLLKAASVAMQDPPFARRTEARVQNMIQDEPRGRTAKQTRRHDGPIALRRS